ncbi:DUF4113 domain-containing protein [Kushneria phyllosphaerae]|uniref:DUF4113 domain-containing protein n=1 Tax=Kushneria phyllosphaerae TaxID=2100822 RepID=UPI001FAEF3FE|nr:DUF4113 domain-containing protein [Kushneria phyllosphaerae]
MATAQSALARLWKPRRIFYQKCGGQLNTRFGRNTVTVGVQRQQADWQLRCSYRSNRWTTRWEELPVARLT